jgi:hypothetical protein
VGREAWRWHTDSVTTAENPQRLEVALAVDWSDATDLPVLPANQFLVQLGVPVEGKPDGVYLIVGHAAPPVIVGPDLESQRMQVEKLGGRLKVEAHARYHFSRERLGELLKVLNALTAQYDGAVEGENSD